MNAQTEVPRLLDVGGLSNRVVEGLPRLGDHVFLGPNKRPLKKYGALRSAWLLAVKKAGLWKLRFHDLRHQFASELVMKGFDLVTVKDLLGHSSLRMVMRYAHLTADHKRMAVEALGGEAASTKKLEPHISRVGDTA